MRLTPATARRSSVLSRYVIPLFGLALATVVSVSIHGVFADHSAISIMYLLAVLASAWFGGYGPGILACLIGLFVAPYLFTPHFDPRHVDLIRAGLVLCVSMLISRVALSERQSRESLREANQLLDSRVRERTSELEKSNTELQVLNEALNEFAYSMSHDLQQPLRMLCTYSQILERRYQGQLDEEAGEYLKAIVGGARRMSCLLDDLLAYSRSVNTDVSASEAVAVKDVLHEVLEGLKLTIKENDAAVEIGELPLLRVRRFHLQALLQNLLANALKYRSADRPVIRISAERQGPMCDLTIADNGIGIDPEHRKQIFGLFKRLHSDEEYEGTGVGLAICEAIVKRYGGRIWVDGAHPHGSVFHLLLPVGEDIPGKALNGNKAAISHTGAA